MTDDDWIAPALAANPSVPEDLLTEMASTHDEKLQLALIAPRRPAPMSLSVATVLADSPHPRVRQDLAGCVVADEIVVRLAADPNPGVRLSVVLRPEEVFYPMPCYVPEAAYALLTEEDDPRVQGELLYSFGTPEHVKRAVARRAHPDLRDDALLRFGTDGEATGAYHRMVTDSDPEVRRTALRRGRFRPPADLVPGLLADAAVRLAAIRRIPLTAELARALATDPDPDVRCAVTANPDLPDDLVELLSHDPDERVRMELFDRPHLPLHVVDRYDDAQDRPRRTTPVEWLWKHRDDNELLDRYSRARHVRYRRTVARVPGLAPETVRRLAADDDYAVRLILTERNPDLVPVELLVEMVTTWEGYSAGTIAGNPRLPDEVIDQLLRSAEPRHRWYAYLSGRLTEEQLALLADDPDPKLAARVDPPAPPSWPEFEARLADPTPVPADHPAQPGHPTVREAAARHPQLPVPLMWQLWRRARSAAHPEETMKENRQVNLTSR
ncbi:hypothetical protein [Plantactinospora sp. WMMB782]|uniref:hypothetical protein n=1 Tax=Plantactinospora sp. WMMB782 TaxID=3404121 RepID=UPI003B96110F